MISNLIYLIFHRGGMAQGLDMADHRFDPVVAPSTTRQCPLVFPDSSDARYRAAFATSIACPGLPRMGDSKAFFNI